jgi:hypothetical protein
MSEIPTRVREATEKVLESLQESGLSELYEEGQISRDLYEKFLSKDSWGWTSHDLFQYWQINNLT